MPLKRQELPGGAARLPSAASQTDAAIAQQLAEPLAALLVFMRELKNAAGTDCGITPALAGTLLDDAMREMQQVCALVEGLRARSATPADAAAVPRQADGESASAWWARRLNAAGEAPSGHSLRHRLTPREREVLNLIGSGATNKEGAAELNISPRTYEAHRAQIMRKLGARNAADLLRKVLAEVG
ncbi:DNA-binding CsgD family transcriptional regulator [Rhodopseudomonas rhenobacensis]|uniref:DNA-binding CsgD family transcriptional regulator n=1 Tax=Rhodopseudomonas rhenobacensis TaxID=87461 RepID=A0A7W7Z3R3_9BRAD|nr:DNA-binding CsgD family transcriptional regulator [Rhodopseudomonas rhenobacensis]